jgi:catechol 2,3-dioxygenase-like lactoylglutathione lyase family enzyme
MDWKLEVVVVPVTDLDRARAFYNGQVGFAVDHDTQVNDDLRIIQLTPRGSGCSIVIGPGLTEAPPGSVKGMQITVSDLDAARGELLDRGVEVTPIQHHDGTAYVDGRGGRWNNFIFFSDPDGNGWALQESPRAD